MSNGFSTDADADVVEAFFKTQALPVGTAFDVAGCRGDTQPRKVHRQDPGKHRHVRCQGVIVYDGVPALRVRSLLTVELWRRLNNRWHGTAMECYGARYKRHTCQDAGAVPRKLPNFKNPPLQVCTPSGAPAIAPTKQCTALVTLRSYHSCHTSKQYSMFIRPSLRRPCSCRGPHAIQAGSQGAA